MPLTPLQASIIESTFKLTIEFPPSNLAQLPEIINKYKEVFNLTLTDESRRADENLKCLENFIKEPNKFFGKLENGNADITEGDVITALVNTITKEIMQSAHVEDPKTIGWDETQILQNLKAKIGAQFNKQYIVAPYVPDAAPDPYNSPSLVHNVQFSMSRSGVFQSEMTLTINFEDEEKPTTRRTHLTRHAEELDQDAMYRRYLGIAQIMSGEMILNHYINNNAKTLLSHKFYFELFKKDASVLNIIRNINPDQLSVFSSPAIIRLIELNIISLQDAGKISLAMLAVIEDLNYFSKICDGSLKLSEFDDINLEQSRTLTSLSVKKLMKEGIITFARAKTITKDYRALLENENYFQRIITREVDFSYFEKVNYNQSENLRLPYFIHLFNNNQNIEKAFTLELTDQARDVMRTAVVSHLLIAGKLQLEIASAFRATTDAAILILDNIFYLKFARTEEIDLLSILCVTHEKSLILFNEGIQCLIQNKAITIKDAIALDAPNYFLKFFKDSVVLDILKENACDHKLLLSITEKQYALFKKLKAKLKNKEIRIEVLFEINKNPLIAHLVEKNYLDIQDIGSIMRFDHSEAIYIPHLGRKLEEQDADTICDYVYLAKEGLLFEEDLSTLYSKIAMFRGKHKSRDGKDEKESSSNVVLDTSIMKSSIEACILKRLDAIQDGKPILFPDKSPDNIKRLMDSLEKHRIFSLDVWMRIMSSRMLRIYQKKSYTIDNFNDSLEKIRADINRICPQLIPAIRTIDWIDLIIKELIMGIQDDLHTKVREGDFVLSPLYFQVRKEFHEGNTGSVQPLFSRYGHSTFWLQSIEAISFYAQDLLQKQTSHADKKPRTDLALFQPAKDEEAVNPILKAACDTIIGFVRDLQKCQLISRSTPSTSMDMTPDARGKRKMSA